MNVGSLLREHTHTHLLNTKSAATICSVQIQLNTWPPEHTVHSDKYTCVTSHPLPEEDLKRDGRKVNWPRS